MVQRRFRLLTLKDLLFPLMKRMIRRIICSAAPHCSHLTSPCRCSQTGEGTPSVTGYLEVQIVGGKLLHSKKVSFSPWSRVDECEPHKNCGQHVVVFDWLAPDHCHLPGSRCVFAFFMNPA